MGVWRVPYHGASEEFLRAHVGYDGDDCLLWPYSRNEKGYGLAVIGGKQRGAHNWMCRLAHGEPYSIWRSAAHSCDNPPCVNPRHLRWTTHVENMHEKERTGGVPRGEKSGRTHLTEEDVLAIRNAPADLQKLAERYGIGKRGISHIRGGRRWAHVGGPRSCKERGSSPTCRNGHPFDQTNTKWTTDGYRQCRACGRVNALKAYHRKKALDA